MLCLAYDISSTMAWHCNFYRSRQLLHYVQQQWVCCNLPSRNIVKHPHLWYDIYISTHRDSSRRLTPAVLMTHRIRCSMRGRSTSPKRCRVDLSSVCANGGRTKGYGVWAKKDKYSPIRVREKIWKLLPCSVERDAYDHMFDKMVWNPTAFSKYELVY